MRAWESATDAADSRVLASCMHVEVQCGRAGVWRGLGRTRARIARRFGCGKKVKVARQGSCSARGQLARKLTLTLTAEQSRRAGGGRQIDEGEQRPLGRRQLRNLSCAAGSTVPGMQRP